MTRNESIRIFFSYSKRGIKKLILETALDEIKKAIDQRGWKSVDPMKRVSVNTIDKKVMENLRSVDGMIVEASTTVPNVMFEIGVARALQYPIITLINEDMIKNADAKLSVYFALIGKSANKPLPADLGELEYLKYSDDISGPAGKQKFRKDLDRLLDHLEHTTLSLGARLCRRKQNELHFRSGIILESPQFKQDHPILLFLSGWYGRLAENLQKTGGEVFEIDADYYPSCLAAFQRWGGGKVWAIADLSDPTERFWHEQPDPQQTSATERIFLLDWPIFFDRSTLSDIVHSLSRHFGSYLVKLGSVLPSERDLLPPLWPGNADDHLLIIEPDVVGGYSDRKGKKYLRIEKNKALFNQAIQRYEAIAEKAIEIKKDWSEQQVRTAWLQKQGFGIWDKAWHDTRVAERPSDYCRYYDMHIRCWIPDYNELIAECVRAVQREILNLLVGSARKLTILEIGFGTGAVTRPILEWIGILNAPVDIFSAPRVTGFYGVDSSQDMCQILIDRVKNLAPDAHSLFLRGTAWSGLPYEIREKKPYDLIFGSLVLHDLLGEDYTKGIKETFYFASELLRESGSLVFADPFMSNDSTKRPDQVKFWRNWAVRNGLSEEHIEQFFEANREMVSTVSINQLELEAVRAGFERPQVERIRGSDRLSPFAVVVIRKKKANKV
jgi:SAM-dependent methyltransferase